MEFEEEKVKRKIRPRKAQKMLSDEGMDVTLQEAAEILSFLKFMPNGVVKKFLNE
ncbi:hypothetical protein IRZ71_05975 [Flavobacterium sp. ANB]|uniref:hypothetical protein n=1 Tax=unclassified Flavobacterium TaxID=196869 RepID=UPI0012B713D6|nr:MULTISPECIES: hypothetical protein [unclassified Flavobacterium]MBF4515879.1 hypothetical protein [Flavobacterium sp. ANB]MTD68881.1 hypothetical protein [Flavobacterium sp. LC2016-13]